MFYNGYIGTKTKIYKSLQFISFKYTIELSIIELYRYLFIQFKCKYTYYLVANYFPTSQSLIIFLVDHRREQTLIIEGEETFLL